MRNPLQTSWVSLGRRREKIKGSPRIAFGKTWHSHTGLGAAGPFNRQFAGGPGDIYPNVTVNFGLQKQEVIFGQKTGIFRFHGTNTNMYEKTLRPYKTRHAATRIAR